MKNVQAPSKNRLVTKDGSGRYWASNGDGSERIINEEEYKQLVAQAPSGGKKNEIKFYKAISSYGHNQLVFSIPKEVSKFLKINTTYEVTIRKMKPL